MDKEITSKEIMSFYEKREENKGLFTPNITNRKNRSNSNKKELNIVYVMVWTEVCGGSKILLQYINKLSELGHKLTIVSYDKKPTWYDLDDNVNFIKVELDEELNEKIPECDLVIATSWKTISDCVTANVAPVIYFEQGGSHLFEVENIRKEKYELVKNRFDMLENIYTVSNYAKDCIKKYYGKDSTVIPNAVDKNIFYVNENKKVDKDKITLTTIGSEDFKFKNVSEIIAAVEKLQENYDNIDFKWISQKEPVEHKIDCIVNPKQHVIGDVLRNTDIYVCASEYEAFGLPLLEAMSCGATAITTDTGGSSDIVKEGVNGLYIEKHNIEDMCNKIEYLINNKELMDKFKEEAKKTAAQYSWDISTRKIEEYYQGIFCKKIEFER